ncbi:poliovirus receptor-like, partial [Pholidichthys leucotaenia]
MDEEKSFRVGVLERNGGILFLMRSALVLSALLVSREVEAFQVIGGEATVMKGGSAVLPCKLVGTNDRLNQITWQRKTKGKPLGDNFYTILPTGTQFINGKNKQFKFIGNFNDKNGTLKISNVSLEDEGTYTCIFTLFPSGNHKTEIKLSLLVTPFVSLKESQLTVGNEEVTFATCMASGSKPPARVTWSTGTLEEKLRVTTNSTEHSNGTTTTFSSLLGVPTREINGQNVTCVVSGEALMKEETRDFTINVHFPPTEVNITEKLTNAFECVTESNPEPNITWTRSGQSLPHNAIMEGATLKFQSMTLDMNGLYQCEAANMCGRKQGQLYVHVTSESCTAVNVLFGLLIALIVAGAAAFYLIKTYIKSINIPCITQGER